MTRSGVIAGLLLAVAGCTQVTDGEISDSISQRWTWGSFISGEDIASACTAESRGRYRFTYFGDQSKQVRVYDLDVNAGTLRKRIITSKLTVGIVPLGAGFTDVFRPRDETIPLTSPQIAAIETALVNDGFGSRPAQDKQMLLSEWYFWLVRGCRDGETRLRVWVHPDDDFKALTFPETLFSIDPTEVAVQQPRFDYRSGPVPFNPNRDDSFAHYMMWAYPEKVEIGTEYSRSRFTLDR